MASVTGRLVRLETVFAEELCWRRAEELVPRAWREVPPAMGDSGQYDLRPTMARLAELSGAPLDELLSVADQAPAARAWPNSGPLFESLDGRVQVVERNVRAEAEELGLDSAEALAIAAEVAAER